jgi:hypothetical protein
VPRNVREITDYLAVVAVRFKALLGGGSVLILALGLWEHFAQVTVPWGIYALIAVVCFVTALVGLGVEEHSKLARKLRILPTAMPQHFIAMGGVSCVLYYLEILNESEGKTVDNVNVSLVRVAPAIESLSWLPVSLHIKHDNAKPHRTSFSLNPNEHKQIDLVSAPESADRIGVNASDVALDLPVGDYILTVKATGKDVPPSEAAFRVWADDTGKLRCVAI